MTCDHRKALDLARAGDWQAAHAMVMRFDDPLSCLIHAWLHRVEGDPGNAGYWYRRAGETAPTVSTDDELMQLYARLGPTDAG